MRVHLVAVLCTAFVTLTVQASGFGEFKGTVQAEWLPDGRKMRLVKDFSYIDPSGLDWLAPKGAIVDGASIPRVFWIYIGGPFEGQYRNASVVHDVACARKSRGWKAVHKMFYNASRLGGVGFVHALLMYGAVYHFGPRWPDPADARLLMQGEQIVSVAFLYTQSSKGTETESRRLTTDEDFLRMRAYIFERGEELTLDDVEQLTSEFLKKYVPKAPLPIKIAPDT